MAARHSSHSSRVSIPVVIGFVLCVIALLFNSGIKGPFADRITWPQAIYTLVVFPFFYFLGGYVFSMVFLRGIGSSTPGWVHVILRIITAIIFILIILSVMIYLQSFTPVGSVITITLSKKVLTLMRSIMSMHVLLFIGGMFLYYLFY